MDKLAEIQGSLKVPKNQKNSFGNYNYRSCEDILEAVKPLLGEAVLTISDDIIEKAGWYYVKATATLTYGQKKVEVSAFARESLTKKGMDEAQITGAASSYARKYALNGMFLIDDTKDADSQKPETIVKKPPLRTYKTTPVVAGTTPKIEPVLGATAPLQPQQSSKISEKQRKRLYAIWKANGVKDSSVLIYLKGEYGIDKTEDILCEYYDDIVQFVQNYKEPSKNV